jgi:DNA helicase HerA-like ATPase
VSPSSGKALPEFGTLLRQGRKYGAVLIMATQRGTEISKTAWTQVQHRYIGQQEANDRKRLAIEADIQPAEIAALNPMQFFYKRSGAQAPEKITLKPRKIN